MIDKLVRAVSGNERENVRTDVPASAMIHV